MYIIYLHHKIKAKCIGLDCAAQQNAEAMQSARQTAVECFIEIIVTHAIVLDAQITI